MIKSQLLTLLKGLQNNNSTLLYLLHSVSKATIRLKRPSVKAKKKLLWAYSLQSKSTFIRLRQGKRNTSHKTPEDSVLRDWNIWWSILGKKQKNKKLSPSWGHQHTTTARYNTVVCQSKVCSAHKAHHTLGGGNRDASEEETKYSDPAVECREASWFTTIYLVEVGC